MRFDVVTIFPEFFRGPLDHGIVRRAQEAGLAEIRVEDLREFTHDRHRTVDDRPFGGGEGMVLKPEPLFAAVEQLVAPASSRRSSPSSGDTSAESAGNSAVPHPPSRDTSHESRDTAIILLSASGKLFRQHTARRLAQLDRIILLCGRYEGVDERVAEHLATDELSIGDFVLSGGELPATLIIDAVTRLLPGALGNEDSAANESFSACSSDLQVATDSAGAPLSSASFGAPAQSGETLVTRHSSLVTDDVTNHESQVTNHGILDFPHYTRPADFRGWKVPEVLIGGNHAEVRRWRRKMALAKTMRNRPDLLAAAQLSEEDLRLIKELGPRRL